MKLVSIPPSDHCRGYKIPVPVEVDGLDVVIGSDTITLLRTDVYICRRDSDRIRVSGIASFDSAARRLNFFYLRSIRLHGIQSSAVACRVVFVEACGSGLYMRIRGKDLGYYNGTNRILRDIICHFDPAGVRQLEMVGDAAALRRIVDRWRCSGGVDGASTFLGARRPVKYLNPSADVGSSTVLRASGQRYDRLDRVTMADAFAAVCRSSVWGRRNAYFARVLAAVGEPSVLKGLGVALVRAAALEQVAVAADRDGNVFYLDYDRSLSLFDADLRKVYEFGRLPIDGCRRPRMALDDERGLLSIWCCESGVLKVFSVRM